MLFASNKRALVRFCAVAFLAATAVIQANAADCSLITLDALKPDALKANPCTLVLGEALTIDLSAVAAIANLKADSLPEDFTVALSSAGKLVLNASKVVTAKKTLKITWDAGAPAVAASADITYQVSLPAISVKTVAANVALADNSVLPLGAACEYVLPATFAVGAPLPSGFTNAGGTAYKSTGEHIDLPLKRTDNTVTGSMPLTFAKKIVSLKLTNSADDGKKVFASAELPIPSVTVTYSDGTTKELAGTDPLLDVKVVDPKDPADQRTLALTAKSLKTEELPAGKPSVAREVSIGVVKDTIVPCGGMKNADAISFHLTIFKNFGQVTFDTPDVLLPGGKVTLKASQVYPDGKTESGLRYDWKLADGYAQLADKVAFNPAPNGMEILYGNFTSSELDGPDSKFKGVIGVEAHLLAEQPDGAPTVKGTVFVSIGKVDGFKPMTVKISVMDDRTAGDLFGRVTSKEFMVANVRMFNDLDKDGHGTPLGSSILAFSASIDVGVTLKKRHLGLKKESDWVDLSNTDILSLGAKFGYTVDDCKPIPAPDQIAAVIKRFKEQVDVAQKETQNKGDNKQTEAAQNRIEFLKGEIAYLEQISKAATSGDPNNPTSQPASDHACPPEYLSYRPYTYEVMLNTVDPRDRRTLRSRILQGAETIGVVASFANAVSVTPGKTKFPTYLDKYGNMLVPGLAKVFPSLKDTERQNVVSMTMKPIEEIPYGSDLERKLFFPKGPITGVLKDYQVKITELDPFRFAMRVAILNKGATGTVTGSAGAPDGVNVTTGKK